jgi:O-antigen ligase
VITREAAAARATHIAQGLTLAAVAWGAFAFGAVYEWAFWPLAGGCLLAGVTALAASRRAEGLGNRALAVALAAIAVAIGSQLVPLPVSLLKSLSPETDSVLRQFDPAYAMGLTPRHTLSVMSADTWNALALYLSFSILALGLARAFSLTGSRPLVEGLAIVGVLLALVGIVQKPLFTGAIYGFWVPEAGSSGVFGPFVNRNHFAGWMLMALPLVLALLGVKLQRGWRGLRPGWRYRVLWLSSPDASRLLLLGAAAGVMSLSLVLTMSRSGMAALALALVLCGWSIVRGMASGSRRMAAMAYVACLVVAIVAWVGVDAIVDRFAAVNWSEFNNRRGAWIDARAIASAFPLTGTGLNTYSVATLFFQRHDVTRHYAQAHNDYLQIAAEGGVLLVLPIAIALITFGWQVRRRLVEDRLGSTSWWLRRGSVAALVAVGLQETVEFSLQMPGNAALFAVVCAIALHRSSTVGGRTAGMAQATAGATNGDGTVRMRLCYPQPRST